MKKILVVDDDLDILGLLTVMLSMNDFSVNTASRGSDVFSAIENNRPDLIILDVSLNGEDGRDICRIIRSSAASADIPVILFSANQELGKEYQAAGAQAFVSKPFELSFLVQTVQRILASSELNSHQPSSAS